MIVRKRYFLIACLCICTIFGAQAQVNLAAHTLMYSSDEGLLIRDTASLFSIKDILIEGNRKTKDYIVLRELSFKQHETYQLNDLVEKFEETRQQLMNTGLFRTVVVSLKSLQGQDVSVSIKLAERWYIYPIPFVRMVDKDFNEWVNQGKDPNRINYGIRVTHKNFTGRNDRLFINVGNGYTKQVSFSYNNLFLDKALKWSSNYSFSVGRNHEIVYNTINNRRVAYKNTSQYVNSFLRARVEVAYRRAIRTRHIFSIGYNYENVADTLFKLNSNFASQRNVIRYPSLTYRMQHYNVDLIAYPKKGFIAETALEKRGICADVNLWQLAAMGSGYWPLSSKYIFNARVAGMVKLPFKQDYIAKQFLGYNNMFMQGYEYNVVDGVAGGYVKAIVMRQLFNRVIHIPSKRIERLNNISLAIYSKVYGNTGYVYDPEPGQNYLSNRVLYSGGLGIDFVLFNDVVIKVEYSANQFGQKGLYLHRRDHF